MRASLVAHKLACALDVAAHLAAVQASAACGFAWSEPLARAFVCLQLAVCAGKGGAIAADPEALELLADVLRAMPPGKPDFFAIPM